MEENKFEKQVQQKMDELKIHPSDSVWKSIELRIEKRKRSNRGIIWFILLFFVFLAGGYLLLNNGQRSIPGDTGFEKKNAAKKANEIPATKNKIAPPGTNFRPGSIDHKNDVAAKVAAHEKINKTPLQQHTPSPAAGVSLKISSGQKTSAVLPATSGVLHEQQEVKNEISENAGIKPPIVQPAEINRGNEKIKVETKDVVSDQPDTGSLSGQLPLQKEDANVKDALKQITTSRGTVKQSNKNKWSPGLLFSAGISAVGNNFLGIANSRSYDYSNANSPGSVQGGGSPRPSGTRSGFGFIAGVFAERNISAKIKLVTGINFKSFTTTNKVGVRNDTTGFYNSQNFVNTYKNHYNFIELPVTFKARLGKGNMPLYWQGGFIISELLSSNALQFRLSSGMYYTNNSIFNKTQLGLNTSIAVVLFSKQKNQLLIGPYFYYGASKLANEGLYNKKHFVFSGLRTEIIFGK